LSFDFVELCYMTFKMLDVPARIVLGSKWNLYGH